METALLPDLPPEKAWEPLPDSEFDAAAASHLLRRLSFSAPPEWVKKVRELGPAKTVEYALGQPKPMEMPYSVANLNNAERYRELREIRDPQSRQRASQAIRRDNLQAMGGYGVDWLIQASQIPLSPQEKMVLFLQNIFVVNLTKVRNAEALFNHQQLLRLYINRPYPDLAKAVSRSPAMIQFLDLNQSQKGKPNENFARELFELFTLGEGHYTERDIKEAARAFTGYKALGTTFRHVSRQQDSGPKTVFGRTGRFSGDDVIDLVFQQPAARTFLPREFCRFYVTELPLPDAYLAPLGNAWRKRDWKPSELARLVFTSRLFYAPAFRGNQIKSPAHFYLGLLQELRLNVFPVERILGGAMRNMGQPFYNPPNVRGWVGGKAWINSSTLAARRQVVQGLFNEVNLQALNGDEYVAVMSADINGAGDFTIKESIIASLAKMETGTLANHLVSHFLAPRDAAGLAPELAAFIDEGPPNRRPQRIREALVTLLQSPPYHLC